MFCKERENPVDKSTDSCGLDGGVSCMAGAASLTSGRDLLVGPTASAAAPSPLLLPLSSIYSFSSSFLSKQAFPFSPLLPLLSVDTFISPFSFIPVRLLSSHPSIHISLLWLRHLLPPSPLSPSHFFPYRPAPFSSSLPLPSLPTFSPSVLLHLFSSSFLRSYSIKTLPFFLPTHSASPALFFSNPSQTSSQAFPFFTPSSSHFFHRLAFLQLSSPRTSDKWPHENFPLENHILHIVLVPLHPVKKTELVETPILLSGHILRLELNQRIVLLELISTSVPSQTIVVGFNIR